MKRKSSRKSENAAEEKNGNENSDAEEPVVKKGSRGRGSRNKTKQPSYNKNKEASEDETGSQSSESQDTETTSQNGNPKKRGRKSTPKKIEKSNKEVENDIEEEETDDKKSKKESDPLADDGDDDAEYEVDQILGEKTVKGVKHFLIRWKGYTEESDTWEPEDTLDCSDLIKAFKAKHKPTKKDTAKVKNKRGKKNGHKKANETDDTWDENADFEVDRILDVYFHRNGSKDFLVSWKGYPPSQNSWEPEANMDCKDLIAKYLAKCDKAKQFEGKELRVNRKPVERLAFSMHEKARRLSKRRNGQQRVHYFDAE